MIGLFWGYSVSVQAEELPYKNPNLPIEERVNDLLKRMTVEEKFWQIYMMPGDLDTGKERFKDGIFGFQVSTVGADDPQMRQMLQYNPKLTAAETVKKVNQIQRYFVEETRLGIPAIIFDEALHGLVRGGATAFPQAIALAATFDTTLVSRVAHAIAMETKSRGIRQILSPVVNLATDVRWGRVEETYGEDPRLSADMGVSFVKNFERLGVITTPKHFAVNSGDGGRDSNPIHYTERFLEETHLVPFKACFQEGGSQSVMTAYNMLDGTPCTANSWLTIEKLRKEWGFDGFTIADADAVGIIHKLHHTINSWEEAGATAVNNGLDVIFQTTYDEHKPFLEACRSGLITEEALNRAVGQVLKAKFRLGLFEHPYMDESEADRWNACAEHRALAYEAACRSMVLLKNEHQTLPLSREVKRIALIGQDAAESADVAVVVAGIEEGEFRDRGYLTLPGRQEELIRRVAATGKPVVVVLIGGSAIVMSEWLDQVPAVLNAWYPGEDGGDAVADILLGDANPSGKLPITYPIDEAQLPLNYSHKPTGRSDDYLNLTGEPLFPFGYGLSYCDFAYRDLKVQPAGKHAYRVSFSIQNQGKCKAYEVPQLYIRDKVASVTQPITRLIHYQSVALNPGETKEVSFLVDEDDLSMLNQSMQRVVEPGDFRLMIGRSCKDIRLQEVIRVDE